MANWMKGFPWFSSVDTKLHAIRIRPSAARPPPPPLPTVPKLRHNSDQMLNLFSLLNTASTLKSSSLPNALQYSEPTFAEGTSGQCLGTFRDLKFSVHSRDNNNNNVVTVTACRRVCLLSVCLSVCTGK